MKENKISRALAKPKAQRKQVKASPAKPAPAAAKQPASKPLTAKNFTTRLLALQSGKEREKIQRYFKTGAGQYGEADQFIGVKMGELFALAIEFAGMPVNEIEKLLESPFHEVRAGAVSIMDKESRSKKITAARLKEFYELYMRRHDRINNWDLVDLGCLHMTGSFLYDKKHDILFKMARSANTWERRTAILSTCFFIRQGDTVDTFRIAELLVNDPEDLVQKATGWMLRFAGDKTPDKLLHFLDKYGASMPRTLLRYSIEKLSKQKKEYYLGLKKRSGTAARSRN